MGHLAGVGERRDLYTVLVGNPEERKHLVDADVDEKILFRRIFMKWDVRGLTGYRWLRIEAEGRHL
jgi:hypothetical protein